MRISSSVLTVLKYLRELKIQQTYRLNVLSSSESFNHLVRFYLLGLYVRLVRQLKGLKSSNILNVRGEFKKGN